MAGVGKSALAVHVAHLLSDRYPDRLYLDLHSHDPVEEPVDPMSGLGILLRTLGVPPKRVPGTLEERGALWRALLANRRALIVLDDADDPEQIRPLLPGAPGCLVLITSRRRMLGLSGMLWLPLDIMPSDEAISLFTQIVGNERATDPAAIENVVHLCGYLPLAIQLEGSRYRQHPAWSISDLASQLARSQSHIGHTILEDREVAASLELSHRYLSREQQRLFRRLALHPGADFSVYAAAAATGAESLRSTERALEELLDHHLLNEHFSGRYTFHDLIRQYALNRTQVDDDISDQRNSVHRFLDYYLHIASQAADVIYPFRHRISPQPTHVPALQPPLKTSNDFRIWIESERANILNVVHYAAKNGWSQHASLLPHLLAQFFDSWGYWADAATLHSVAVRSWREMGNTSGEARALTDLSSSLGLLGRYSEALECASNALSLFRDNKDQAGEASALDHMGLIMWRSSRYHDALSCHEKALVIWRILYDRHGEADALAHSAIPLWHTNQYEEAMTRFAEALVIYQEIGDLQGVGKTQNNIGDVQERIGFYDEALARYRQALQISQNIGDRQGEAIMLNNIGNIFQKTSRYDESLNYYRKALAIYREIGDRRGESDTLNNLGATLQLTGHYGEALINHQKALVMAHELAEPYQEARSIYNIGNTHLLGKNYVSAADDFSSTIELSHRIGDHYQEALALDGLGNVLLETEGQEAAKDRWQRALELFERMGVPEADAVRDRLRLLNGTRSLPHERT